MTHPVLTAVSSIVASTLLVLSLITALSLQSDEIRPTPLLFHEAEILIYLLPVATQLRSQSMDIGWELQTSSKLNQADYYVFYVYNRSRPSGTGSVTIGYFFVNKHTADVWDDGKENLVLSPELEGVQNILRRAHHIDERTIIRYRNRKIYRSEDKD